MSDQVELIWYENLTRPKPEDCSASEVKKQPESVKQQTPKPEPVQKKPVKLAES